MGEMEFLRRNILNTTTMVGVDSNTDLVQYLFDRNPNIGWSSSGYNSTTATTITVAFDSTTPVSHILLQKHNLKDFELFYDTNTAGYSLASYSTNSDSSSYISFNTVSASKILLVMNDTIQGSVEKSVGELIISDREMSFDRNPSVDTFNPIIKRAQIEHIMPNGGSVLYNIKDKYRAKIGLKFIESAFYSNLLTIYESAVPLYFVPIPTSTAWDGKAYTVNWVGDFNFKYAENTKNHWSGEITLREIP